MSIQIRDSRTEDARRAGTSASHRLKIVLIEDDPDIREMIGDLFTRWEHDVFLAHDGELGIEMILDKRPAVALIDIGLPDLDGYEVAHQVRTRWCGDHLSLVALTGFVDPDRSFAAGFDLHLVKPIDTDGLRRILERDHGAGGTHAAMISRH